RCDRHLGRAGLQPPTRLLSPQSHLPRRHHRWRRRRHHRNVPGCAQADPGNVSDYLYQPSWRIPRRWTPKLGSIRGAALRHQLRSHGGLLMPHALTSAMITELAKANIRPRIFLEAQFTSGTIYVWSDVTPIDWNGHTWTGIGHLGSISPAPETTEVRADNIVISLSGIPSSLVSKVLGEVRPNYPVKVWFGCLSESGAVIADPYLTFQGLMDVPTIQENGQTATISITVENRMVDLQRARERRYTDKDQQQLYPGDKFF